jgi:hypothetical protein
MMGTVYNLQFPWSDFSEGEISMTRYFCGKPLSFSVLVFFLLVLPSVAAEPTEVPASRLEIQRVALFKNGLGFYTMATSLPGDADTVRIDGLPDPVFGTLWVGYGPKVMVDKLVSKVERVPAVGGVTDLVQLLRKNVGREVILHTSVVGQPRLRGTLLAYSEEQADKTGADLRPSNRRYPSPSASFLLVQTDSATVAINTGMIQRVDFDTDGITTSVETHHERPVLILELEKPARDEKVSVHCLATGAAWTPSYLIDLTDPETAKFHAKAVIVNEIADFENVELELVTGFPNIKFGDDISPMAMRQRLAGLLRVRGGREGRVDVMSQMVVRSNAIGTDESWSLPTPEYSTVGTGQVAEDLFFYPVEKFTLKKNETALKPLFSTEMPYQHVYIWKVDDAVDAAGNYRSETHQGEPLAEEVWHSCRLTNTLDMPLTTAATEFVADGQFVGQDICYYTAPGTETTIRINKALNVRAHESEVEVARTRDALQIRHASYDLVQVKGELKLRNGLSETITLEVTKNLTGEVIETTPQAHVLPTAKGLSSVNTKHVLTFKIDLESGDTVVLVYRYQIYIRT